jgi:hypothetical protein
MKNKPTVFGTVAGLTALMGVLPLLITFGIAQLFPSWSALVLTIITLALMVGGAWVFSILFGD